ncbi:MAG: hypothetical protein ABR968_04835 [Bacteroidales bacterium]|jgi:hypothetical protein
MAVIARQGKYALHAAHKLSPVLTLKQTYYMRNRKVGKKGKVNDWSDWFEFIVNKRKEA